MDLKSGEPFWPIRNGLPAAYPRLKRNLKTEIAVIGAGVTGAMIADRLIVDGRDVVVLDGREVACGSTSASTALIQYEIDTPLGELAERYGEAAALSAYRACLEAIGDVERLDRETGGKGRFKARPSFYQASGAKDVDALRAEYELRARHDFPVELWDQARIGRHFDFEAPLAIWSSAGGEVDPHALTHALLARVARKGAVFDRAHVETIERVGKHTLLTLDDGLTVECKEVVVAAGYESLRFLPKIKASLRSTFAFVSDPVAAFPGWYERCLMWESARPYHYFRTTDDDRLLAGGEDTIFQNKVARDLLIPSRLRAVEEAARHRFPRLDFSVDFVWTGTFAETFDGLPFLGRHPERPGQLFALCYGGNGITYSAIAAELIAAELAGAAHPLAEVMGFERSGGA